MAIPESMQPLMPYLERRARELAEQRYGQMLWYVFGIMDHGENERHKELIRTRTDNRREFYFAEQYKVQAYEYHTGKASYLPSVSTAYKQIIEELENAMTTYSEYRDSLPYARGAEVFDPPIGPSHERWLDPADVEQEIEECPAVGKMTRNHKLVPMLQWCTRAIYHDGDHAAHGGNTVMFARWPR